ncbi:MAG TPA: efflux RND transporter permease subunit, partial [Gemmatales bacterium]|nr:efflux RND transporter permease subunit [Gemmatales bacterium]
PSGYRVAWLGMFENLERARKHFLYLIPITAVLILILLVITFRSFVSALLVVAGIPFACIGALMALYIRDMHINVSTGVGFCALFGIAIMDGVLMVRGINVLRESGMELLQAILNGAQQRLRPILMTAIVAIFGLLPASLATGLGSDVQRPLATVIVWGLFSAMVLTLFVLPVLYFLVPPGIVVTGTKYDSGH